MEELHVFDCRSTLKNLALCVVILVLLTQLHFILRGEGKPLELPYKKILKSHMGTELNARLSMHLFNCIICCTHWVVSELQVHLLVFS